MGDSVESLAQVNIKTIHCSPFLTKLLVSSHHRRGMMTAL